MDENRDIVIVGGGPSGLAAAIYAGRARFKTVILEKMMLGGQVALTNDIANYPGFPDGVAGPELTELMEKQARKFGAEIRLEEVVSVSLDGDIKIVATTAGNAYRAPVVILSSGADPRKLECPGEEELRGRGVSYCATCDGPFFRNKVVTVIGGGDAALKEGLFLTKFASRVILVHRRQGFRAEKIYVEEARQNPKFEFVLDAVVKEIQGGDKVKNILVENVITKTQTGIPCDGVFIFVGHLPNSGMASKIVETDPAGHVATNRDMETKIPGLYAIGDLRQGSYRQIATGVGEGVTAAMHAERRIDEWIRTGVWSH